MAERLEVRSAQELKKRARLLAFLFWPFALLSLAGAVDAIKNDKTAGEIAMWVLAVPFFGVAPVFFYALRPRIGHNHYELHFENGRCAIADLMADNFHEVRELVTRIEAGTNPFTGAPIGPRSRG